jgi:hypothetical protein
MPTFIYRFVRSLILFAVIAFLAACSASTPTPVPTALPTEPPTSTPVPPTATDLAMATIKPTRTPEPAAKVEKMLLALDPEFKEAQKDNAVFDFGAPALYAQVEYQGMPQNFSFSWILTREGRQIAAGTAHPLQSSGTLTFTIDSGTGPLWPSDYRLTMRAFNQSIERRFAIKSDHIAGGTTLLAEDFKDNSNSWTLYDRSWGTSNLTEETLQVHMLKKDSWIVGILPIDVADLDMSVDVGFNNAMNSSALIFFRSTSGASYVLCLSANGDWRLNELNTEEWKPLTDWQASKNFKLRQVNHVQIVASGNSMAFYLNGVVLGTLMDKDFSHGAVRLGASSGDTVGATVSFDNLVIKTPSEEVALVPTSVASTKPKATTLPKPTAAPKTPPLADVVRKTLKQVEALGGTMDRLYNGGGIEACAPFIADYNGVVGAPQYDVAAQPANVQGAYATYRQAISLIANKVSSIAEVCQKGGGAPSRLSFDVARMSVNEAGSLLTNALSALGQ